MLHDSSSRAVASDISVIRRGRWATSAAFFLDGFTFATWVSRIPVVQEHLGLRNASLGMALLMMSAGAMVAMPLTGRLTARHGSRLAVAVAVALFGGGLLLPGLAGGLVSLCLALFMFGAGFGAVNVSINAQAVTVEKRYGRPIMASFHAAFSLGGIAGAAAGAVAAGLGVPAVLHFAAVGAAVVASATLLRRWLLHDSARSVDVPNPTDAAVRAGGTAPDSGRRRLALLGAIAVCSALGEGAMADWSGVFLRQVSGTGAAVAALGFAAFSVSMTAGRLAADRITAAVGRVRVVRFSGLLAAAGVMLAVLLPNAVTAVAGFACVGAGLAALIPTTFSAAGRLRDIPPAVAIATVSTVGYCGFLAGPPLIGVGSEWVTLRWALLLVCAGCCIAASLARHVEGRPAATFMEGTPVPARPARAAA